MTRTTSAPRAASRPETTTSKSQRFHCFPDGTAELVRAVVALQGERVLDAQRGWGRPVGSLAAEAAGTDAQLAGEIDDDLRGWRKELQAGLERMAAAGLLRDDAPPPERHAAALFAQLQGGLLPTRTEQALWPLAAALDGALVQPRAALASGR